jgi:hypothetical protein
MAGISGYLTLDTLSMLILLGIFIYFVVTCKKKKYPFFGLKNGFRGSGRKGSKKYKLPKSLQSSKSLGRESKPKKVNQHEERCRVIFEKLFGEKFKSVRPSWLKNPVTGRNLELDGFCSHIKTPIGTGLAFEYDGVQHSKFNGDHFHKKGGVSEFAYQIKKDDYKNLKCKEQQVLLIRIPHFVAFQDLERFIKTQCQKHGLAIKNGGNMYD